MKNFIFFLLIFSLFSCGTAKKNEEPAVQSDKSQGTSVSEETYIIITGTVRIFGTEPRTYAGIVAEDGTQYAVHPSEKDAEIRHLQGRPAEFTVIVLDQPQGLGGLMLRGGTVTPVSWRIIQ